MTEEMQDKLMLNAQCACGLRNALWATAQALESEGHENLAAAFLTIGNAVADLQGKDMTIYNVQYAIDRAAAESTPDGYFKGIRINRQTDKAMHDVRKRNRK